jgi:DNA repair exonuclease SbcCD ATPase subunit
MLSVATGLTVATLKSSGQSHRTVATIQFEVKWMVKLVLPKEDALRYGFDFLMTLLPPVASKSTPIPGQWARIPCSRGGSTLHWHGLEAAELRTQPHASELEAAAMALQECEAENARLRQAAGAGEDENTQCKEQLQECQAANTRLQQRLHGLEAAETRQQACAADAARILDAAQPLRQEIKTDDTRFRGDLEAAKMALQQCQAGAQGLVSDYFKSIQVFLANRAR